MEVGRWERGLTRSGGVCAKLLSRLAFSYGGNRIYWLFFCDEFTEYHIDGDNCKAQSAEEISEMFKKQGL